jgi:hypothetical protein
MSRAVGAVQFIAGMRVSTQNNVSVRYGTEVKRDTLDKRTSRELPDVT